MKNITLSADEGLIEEARRIAATKSTTLNAEFRRWLADYVSRGPALDAEARKRQAEKAIAAMNSVAEVIDTGGRKFTRDEMNERRLHQTAEERRQHAEAGAWLAAAGGSEPQIEDIHRRRSEM